MSHTNHAREATCLAEMAVNQIIVPESQLSADRLENAAFYLEQAQIQANLALAALRRETATENAA